MKAMKAIGVAGMVSVGGASSGEAHEWSGTGYSADYDEINVEDPECEWGEVVCDQAQAFQLSVGRNFGIGTRSEHGLFAEARLGVGLGFSHYTWKLDSAPSFDAGLEWRAHGMAGLTLSSNGIAIGLALQLGMRFGATWGNDVSQGVIKGIANIGIGASIPMDDSNIAVILHLLGVQLHTNWRLATHDIGISLALSL